MFKVLRVIPVLMALAPTVALAQAEFSGTWKMDAKTAQFPKKPDIYLLKDGVFSCKSCVPPYEVKADGMVHPVAGSPYYDSLKLKVVDAHTLAGERIKAGRVTGRMQETISGDGGMLTMKFDDLTVASSPVTGTYTAARIAPAPAGAHAISGSWRQNAISDMSDNGMLSTVMVKDGMVHFSTPSGQSYVAKLGGGQAPFVGDPGVTTVSIMSSGPHQMTETDYRAGKPVTVEKMTVAPDGHTMSMTVDDKLHTTTSSFTFVKQ